MVDAGDRLGGNRTAIRARVFAIADRAVRGDDTHHNPSPERCNRRMACGAYGQRRAGKDLQYHGHSGRSGQRLGIPNVALLGWRESGRGVMLFAVLCTGPSLTRE